jgi:beta-phosphoglucomutase-like phosphatase (HAD superfamily)
MFSGYVLTWEGTLVNSLPQNLRSLQETLEKAGIDIPYGAVQLYSGLDPNQTLEIIVPGLAEARRKQILRAHRGCSP